MVTILKKNIILIHIGFTCIFSMLILVTNSCSKNQALTGPEATFTCTPFSSSSIENGTVLSSTPNYYDCNVKLKITNFNPSFFYYFDFSKSLTGQSGLNQRADSSEKIITIKEGSEQIKLIAASSYGTTENILTFPVYSPDSVAQFIGTVNYASAFTEFKIDIYGANGSYYNYQTIYQSSVISPASKSANFNFKINLKKNNLLPRFNTNYQLKASVKIQNFYTLTTKNITLQAINNIIFN